LACHFPWRFRLTVAAPDTTPVESS
jgi:hypothetical protein